MSTLAREPPTRRFCSTTATTTRGLPSGCQPKRRLDSKQIRRMASRFYWTSTTAAGTASAIREPNRFAVQRMYSLLCSGNSAIRSFSRQNRNRNPRTSTPAFSSATANTKKRAWIAMRSLHHLSSRTMQSHVPPIVTFLRIKLMDGHQLDDCYA